jgi:hypothetical protein
MTSGNWILYVAPGPSYRLRYTVAKNRWCQNVQRSHKSNGIALECDLTFMVITQVCFDSDCKGYRSEPVPLPTRCSLIRSNPLENRKDFDNFNGIPEKVNFLQRNQNESDIITDRVSINLNKNITLHERCEEIHKLITLNESLN